MKKEKNDLLNNLEITGLDITEITDSISIPETGATSGSGGHSTCGSSSCCSSCCS
ncbi:thiazolylpeptide-type bacteriocin [Bacillus velezensis]|uniref:thiazolylpeptide-type bacteriocin n=1 Tax=Bacillus velezensis TaxID=492670 RepID=UPI001E3AB147|nr:thiazolylpeptide-type bacteriocin [Bacillus velezensis]